MSPEPHIGQCWARQHPNAEYIPVASAPDPTWQGRKGYVHRAVIAYFINLSAVDVYACGSPLMIEAAKRDFVVHGLNEWRFYSNAFTPATQD